MSYKSIGPLAFTLLVSFVGAGTGALAWFEFFTEEKVASAVAFGQDDFYSPVFLPFTLTKEASLTVSTTASSLVYNPDFGKPRWKLGTGVSLGISIDGEPCGDLQTKIVNAPIKGRTFQEVDASCGPQKLGPGQHFVRIQAKSIGNCKPVPSHPPTCNTNRIRGAYALIE